jgi:hypothetical protein
MTAMRSNSGGLVGSRGGGGLVGSEGDGAVSAGGIDLDPDEEISWADLGRFDLQEGKILYTLAGPYTIPPPPRPGLRRVSGGNL